MNRFSLAAMLILAFSLSALAQDAKVGVLTPGRAGHPSISHSTAPTLGLPSVPVAIIFYGGDIAATLTLMIPTPKALPMETQKPFPVRAPMEECKRLRWVA